MLRIFTTPNVMQNYISDLITYRFISKLKENYSRPFLNEDSNELHLIHDKKVPKILQGIMKSYKGFSFEHDNGDYVWVHDMKPSRNYLGTKLVVCLRDNGNYFSFTTYILLGKRRRKSSGVSIFGVLAVISLLILLALVGSYEQSTINTVQFIVGSIISLFAFLLNSKIDHKVSPYISEEDESYENSKKFHTN